MCSAEPPDVCGPLVVTLNVKCTNGQICIVSDHGVGSSVSADFMDLDSDIDSDVEEIDLTLEDDQFEEDPVPLPEMDDVLTEEEEMCVSHHEEMVCTLPYCTDHEVDQCVGQLLAKEYVRQRSCSVMDKKSILALKALTEKCCDDDVFDEVVISSRSDICNEVVIGSSLEPANEDIPLGNCSPENANEEAAVCIDEHMLSYVDLTSPTPPACTLQVSSSG